MSAEVSDEDDVDAPSTAGEASLEDVLLFEVEVFEDEEPIVGAVVVELTNGGAFSI